MTDLATEWIYHTIQKTSGERILCADENHAKTFSLSSEASLSIFTNRYDIAQQLTSDNVAVILNDFDFSSIQSNTLDHFYYRISKEKAVTHHIINEAARCLKIGGTLWLAGGKNEGIKTYIEKTEAVFGESPSKKKNGTFYFSHVKKADISTRIMLDDSNYSSLREISFPHLSFFSKPGIFGWNKIDRGSELLVEYIKNYSIKCPLDHIVDLGCGYGYLTLATHHHFSLLSTSTWTLTDNNVAALAAAEKNITSNNIVGRIQASDAGDQVSDKADVILCNPPFHQGFSVDGDLTTKFLKNTKRLLHKHGFAFFVVNQFIPVEKKAADIGLFSETLGTQEGFKFVVLSHSNPNN